LYHVSCLYHCWDTSQQCLCTHYELGLCLSVLKSYTYVGQVQTVKVDMMLTASFLYFQSVYMYDLFCRTFSFLGHITTVSAHIACDFCLHALNIFWHIWSQQCRMIFIKFLHSTRVCKCFKFVGFFKPGTHPNNVLIHCL